MRSILLFLFFILINTLLSGQEDPYRNIYLAGNISGLDVKSVYLNDFLNKIEHDNTQSTLLFLGDFSKGKKLKKSLLKRLKSIKKKKDVDISFIPGDKEWNSLKPNGAHYVKKIEENLEDELKKVFSPNDGCPGPTAKNIDDKTVLITINTSWFLTDHEKQEGFNSTCNLLFETEFWEELEDQIEDNKGKNIIIAGHHPVYSNGYYSGKGSRLIEWIPLLGSMFYAYRNQDGSAKYLSNKKYQHFRMMMERTLNKFQGLIYVSGHEHSIELQNVNANLHINSGAANFTQKAATDDNTLFTQYEKGFTCISLYLDGRIKAKVFNTERKNKTNSYVDYVMLPPCANEIANNKILNHQFSNCTDDASSKETTVISNTEYAASNKMATAIPGIEYKAGSFASKWMGENYRKEWSTEVSLPYLNLKTEKGGLTAFGKGGGKQTNSLKLINPKNEQFAFRSVNKNTGRDPYDPFRNTIVTSYTQELISNQLPFGDILVSKLLDHTDILHMKPRAFIMPDDPSLGKFQKDFAHVLGTLEERPKGKKRNRPGFADADIIVSSNQMYRYLLKDNSNYFDGLAFAKSILFDAWICDWDKHGDNWKWAGYKEGKHYRFVPIPKDRDHVFAIYEGIIPGLAKHIIPFYAHFSENLDNTKSITYQGRHMVNFVGSKLTQEDWLKAADYLMNIFDVEKIDEAIAAMPQEMRHISSERIKTHLLSRLDQLDDAAREIFKLYNKTGVIVGTNEKELFTATRNADASVNIRVEKPKSKKLIFEKTFVPEITKEIHLYGLGKDDEFIIQGECDETINLRIIGGAGEDRVTDLAKVKSKGLPTKVYDKYSNDKIQANSRVKIKKEYQDPEYKIFKYEYNSFIPLLVPSYTTDFGFFFLGTYDFKNHGFNKPDYQHHLLGNFSWVPKLDNFKAKGKYFYRQFWGNRNLLARYTLAYNDMGFDDFFGISNNTVVHSNLNKSGFYDFNNTNYSLSLGMNNNIFNKSDFEFGFGLQHYTTKRTGSSESIFDFEPYRSIYGFGKNWNAFIHLDLDMDFLDNSAFPTKGARLEATNTIYKILNEDNGFHGIAEASLIEYYSIEVLRKTTLAIKIGGSYNYGKTPFYHLSSLGNNNNLRTYSSNTFLGKGSVYTNFQLRQSIGTVRNRIIPFNYGLIFFYDTGRVFNNENLNFNDWNYGYGTGAYISILKGMYNLHFNIGKNQYDVRFLRVGIGLGLE